MKGKLDVSDKQMNPHAIPFITYTFEKGFQLNPETQKMILQIEDNQIAVLSIAGKYRTGKSFLMNRVILDTKGPGFQVGSTINSCTKGLWIWSAPLKLSDLSGSKDASEIMNHGQRNQEDQKDMRVLVIDSEGIGSFEEGNHKNQDMRILLLTMLLSSFMIYNSVGPLDEQAIQDLFLLINMAKDVHIKANQKLINSDSSSEFFPSLFWVLRDFVLELIDQDGNTLTSKGYLEKALEQQQGYSQRIDEKNQIRKVIKHCFADRDCLTVSRPAEKESQIQKLDQMPLEQMRSKFRDELKQIKQRISQQIKPKQILNQNLNGRTFIALVQNYIDIMNSEETLSIKSVWESLCKDQNMKALQEAIFHVQQRASELQSKGPYRREDLKELKKTLQKEAFGILQQKSMGDADDIKEFEKMVNDRIKEKFEEVDLNHQTHWNKYYEKLLAEDISDLNLKINTSKFQNFEALESQIAKIRNKLHSGSADIPERDVFLLKLAEKVHVNYIREFVEKANRHQEQTLKNLQAENDKMRGEFDQLRQQRDQFFNRNTQLENELVNMAGQKKLYKDQYESSANDLKRKKKEWEELEKNLQQDFETSQRQHFVAISELQNQIIDLKEKAHLERETYERDETRLLEIVQHEISVIGSQNQSNQKQTGGKNGASNCSALRSSSKENELKLQNLKAEILVLQGKLEEQEHAQKDLVNTLYQTIQKDCQIETIRLQETNKNLTSSIEQMEKRNQQLNSQLENYRIILTQSASIKCSSCQTNIQASQFTDHVQRVCLACQGLDQTPENLGCMLQEAAQECLLQKYRQSIKTDGSLSSLNISVIKEQGNGLNQQAHTQSSTNSGLNTINDLQSHNPTNSRNLIMNNCSTISNSNSQKPSETLSVSSNGNKSTNSRNSGGVQPVKIFRNESNTIEDQEQRERNFFQEKHVTDSFEFKNSDHTQNYYNKPNIMAAGAPKPNSSNNNPSNNSNDRDGKTVNLSSFVNQLGLMGSQKRSGNSGHNSGAVSSSLTLGSDAITNMNNNKSRLDSQQESGQKAMNNRSNSCTRVGDKIASINQMIMGSSEKLDGHDLEISIIGAQNDGHVSYHVRTVYGGQVYSVFRSVNDFQELQISLQKLFPKLMITENTLNFVQNINEHLLSFETTKTLEDVKNNLIGFLLQFSQNYLVRNSTRFKRFLGIVKEITKQPSVHYSGNQNMASIQLNQYQHGDQEAQTQRVELAQRLNFKLNHNDNPSPNFAGFQNKHQNEETITRLLDDIIKDGNNNSNYNQSCSSGGKLNQKLTRSQSVHSKPGQQTTSNNTNAVNNKNANRKNRSTKASNCFAPAQSQQSRMNTLMFTEDNITFQQDPEKVLYTNFSNLSTLPNHKINENTLMTDQSFCDKIMMKLGKSQHNFQTNEDIAKRQQLKYACQNNYQPFSNSNNANFSNGNSQSTSQMTNNFNIINRDHNKATVTQVGNGPKNFSIPSNNYNQNKPFNQQNSYTMQDQKRSYTQNEYNQQRQSNFFIDNHKTFIN